MCCTSLFPFVSVLNVGEGSPLIKGKLNYPAPNNLRITVDSATPDRLAKIETTTLFLEEYAQMKAKESQAQSPSSSPPPVLPDLQLVMTFIINGKQVELEKQATVQIQCCYEEFIYSIGNICNAKLPRGKRFLSEGIKI